MPHIESHNYLTSSPCPTRLLSQALSPRCSPENEQSNTAANVTVHVFQFYNVLDGAAQSPLRPLLSKPDGDVSMFTGLKMVVTGTPRFSGKALPSALSATKPVEPLQRISKGQAILENLGSEKYDLIDLPSLACWISILPNGNMICACAAASPGSEFATCCSAFALCIAAYLCRTLEGARETGASVATCKRDPGRGGFMVAAESSF